MAMWPTMAGLPVCREHSIENFHPPLVPSTECRYLAIIADDWRCTSCYLETRKAYNIRAQRFDEASQHRYDARGEAMGEEVRDARPAREDMC